MKQKLIHFFNQPKKVFWTTTLVAVVVGFVGALLINRAPTYEFVTAGPATINTTDSTNQVRDLTLSFLASGRVKTVAVKAGDKVAKGDVLATLDAGTVGGALTQARAAYASAQAAYTKIINGATGTTVDVAKASVATASTNLDSTKKQQDTIVANAYTTLLNSTPQPISSDTNASLATPTITGSYTLNKEGTVTITAHYYSNDNATFVVSGLTSGLGKINTTSPQPIADTGLFITFPSTISSYPSFVWTIDLPNKKAPNYIANYNTYQLALQTRNQLVSAAQSSLDQANASLEALVATARPEDVAAAKAQVDNAQGALQVAEAAYNNTIITAPVDGIVRSVSIAPGQTAVAATSAIVVTSETKTTDVAVAVPQEAIVDRGGLFFVRKKVAHGVAYTPVTLGVSDAVTTEITSGLAVGDAVVLH